MPQQLLPGEVMIGELHRHWIVLFRTVAVPVVLLVLVLAGDFMLRGTLPRDVQIIAALVVVALAGAWLIVAWIRWTGTSITITDQRVILASGVFSRQSKVIPLDRVQDVATRQSLVGRILAYGTVEIDAAGASGAEVIDHLPGPNQFRDEVFVHAGRLRNTSAC